MPLLLAALLVAAPPAAEPAPAPPPPAEKLRCKRYPVTGSLVSFRKECRTEREWAEISRNAQDEFGKMQGRGFKAGQ